MDLGGRPPHRRYLSPMPRYGATMHRRRPAWRHPTTPAPGDRPEYVRFSLLGGPLHRLGQRLRLVRGETNTVALGIVLGGVSWGVLMLLTLLRDGPGGVPGLEALGTHVRLLVVIPLYFLCETVFDPQAAAFVRTSLRTGTVPPERAAALTAEAARVGRWSGSRLADAGCLLAALLLQVATPEPLVSYPASVPDLAPWAGSSGAIGAWYGLVCLPLFRFLTFRWAWRLALWSYFLWRFARLGLALVASHPDRVGGLGPLEVVQSTFAVLIAALSTLVAAEFVARLAVDSAALAALGPIVVVVLIVDAVVFLGPLLLFTPALWSCHLAARRSYGAFAYRYARGFEEKWLGPAGHRSDPLGTPDLQSLADLANSVRIVIEMGLVPASRRLLVTYAGAAVLPLLPPLLWNVSVAAVPGWLLRILLGA